MPIRITGMNSGLDTESIITALTQRQKDKVDTYTGDQKKLTWKQDKWKELNKKAVSFYNGMLSSMRFSTAYNKKTTTASNANAASVITGDNAMLTDQTLNITSLAKAAYLTGKEVTYKDADNKDVKATKATTMDQLGIGNTTLSFKIGPDGSRTDTLSVDIKST
ncbi:MAG: flagellar hook protein, partial [Butyrivibrio sp.]|nr:flagellar hook protein [Butyrivibrio sp.]